MTVAYVLTIIVLQLIGLGVTINHLGQTTYPRRVSRPADVVTVWVTVALAAFGLVVLLAELR